MNASQSALAAILLAVTLVGQAYADSPPALSKGDIEQIVKGYLMKHPETIQASLMAMKEREMAKHKKQMEKAAVTHLEELDEAGEYPAAGDLSAATVTVTEFYDFHCGFCKQMVPTLTRLLEEDKHVRIVFRDFPILSADSEIAAKASVAFYRLNKDRYFDFYSELMKSTGRFDEKSVQAAAAKFGVAAESLKAEMDKPETEAAIAANKNLAKALLISGTPALFVGAEVLPGAAPYEKLKGLIDKARKRKAAGNDS